MRSNDEYMILMKAILDFLMPDVTTAKLVKISTLCHQNVAVAKSVAWNERTLNRDLLDFTQIKESILNVGNAQVRETNRVHLCLFA